VACDGRDEANGAVLEAVTNDANASLGGDVHAARGRAEGAEGTGRNGSCAPHAVSGALEVIEKSQRCSSSHISNDNKVRRPRPAPSSRTWNLALNPPLRH
jgi:hypothetical protein